MKTLLRKKWFRRLCQTLLALVSLWVLAVAAVNWWGARMKRDVIAQMRAEGRPVSMAEMLTPLPRDEDNFAMIPILAQAREEWWNDKTVESIPANGARAKLAALGVPALKEERSFDRGSATDLNRWKAMLRLRGSDAECLETYDRDHGEILGQLRAGLVRPQTISPLLHRRAAEPASFQTYPWGCRNCLRPLVAGLAFRAELALAANRPDVAHESLLIMIRLAEMIRGEVILGLGLQYQLLVRLKPTLTRALESGQLDQGQLASIASQLAVIDPMSHSLRESDLGILETFATFDLMKERGGDFIHPMQYFEQYPMPSWARNLLPAVDKWFGKAEPGGWYDANAARCGRARLLLRRELGEGSNQGTSLQAFERAEAQDKKRNRWLYPYDVDSQTADFKAAFRLQTYFQQAQLACDLETYRLDHGRYPERLVEIKSPAIVDSITGEPYRYRTTGSGYLLYSVGADGRDDGGKRNERHSWNDPDWVW